MAAIRIPRLLGSGVTVRGLNTVADTIGKRVQHTPFQATQSAADPTSADEKQRRQQEQQRVVARLLATTSERSSASYQSLPGLGEAPDLLDNPHLSQLVTPIDGRLLASFYNEIDTHNAQLKFFQTGDQDKVHESFYVRSFMPHCHTSNMFYLKENDSKNSRPHDLPWQTLGNLLIELFASIGVTELRDFYTHVLPATVGRLHLHKDRLQSDTWKVDIRLCPVPTELLVLDDTWYALRFPAGASGFVIDSALFERFHAVRAGPAVQQSVLAVFNKQHSTQQMVREALSRLAAGAPLTAGQRSSFGLLTLPHAPTRHPEAVEANRVKDQHQQHVWNTLGGLKAEVQKIAAPHRGLAQTPRATIDKAIAAFPLERRADVLKIYQDRCKLPQHISSGAARDTQVSKQGYIQGGKKKRVVIDDRLVSIRGIATVDGEALHFPDYDGSEATRLRFAWRRRLKGDHYAVKVSTQSGNVLSQNLARLAKNFGLLPNTTRYTIFLEIVNGDTITGSTAARLRDLGLTVQVEHVDTELDYKTKRARELERRPSSRPRHRHETGRPKPPQTSWLYFYRERLKWAKSAFERLSAEEMKAYEDKLTAQLQETTTETKDQFVKRQQRPRSAWSWFLLDVRKEARQVFAKLSPQERKLYESKAESDRRRHQIQESEWRAANTKPPATAFEIFQANSSRSGSLSDKSIDREVQHRLTREIRAQWKRLGPSGWAEYEQKLQEQIVQQQHPGQPMQPSRA